MDPIGRARQHLDRGDRAAAIAVLREAARHEPPPFVARRELASIYRGMGAPDQAARWGIAIDGWTTTSEREALARALVTYVDPDQLLLLGTRGPEPAALAAVLVRRDELRAAASTQRLVRRPAAGTPAERRLLRSERLVSAAALLIVAAMLIPPVILWTAMLVAREPLAMLLLGIGLLVGALGAGLGAVSAHLTPGDEKPAPWWIVAAVAAGAGIPALVVAAAWS